MRSRRTVEDWRRAVFRSSAITDSTRVVLLLLAEFMSVDRVVSVPRATLANKLGRSERRVTQRVTDAHDAGLLDTVSKGHRGRTAVYVGTFPDADSGTVSSPLSSVGNRPPLKANSGTHGGPTITTADLPQVVTGRDVGSNEEPEGDRAPLSACGEHGWTCPEDCPEIPTSRWRTA